MSLLRKLGEFFGIKVEAPLTEVENSLLTQLTSNREEALQLIPDNMKTEFLSSIYSDKNLLHSVKEICRNKMVTDDGRKYFGELLIIGHISIKGFGRRLLAYYSIDPKYITDIMLNNIAF